MKHSKNYNTFYVVLPAFFLLFLIIGIIENIALKHSGGLFCYPLDDTFIHLAVAKNLALYGNWGATRYSFQSASSSLLYTTLLACFSMVCSNMVIIPFIINIIVGCVLILVLQHWLNKQNITLIGQMIILVSTVIFTPLPVMIITGMEHTLQCLISFTFIYSFSTWLAESRSENKSKPKFPILLYLNAFLLTSIRYEGMFLITITCLVLLYSRHIYTSLKLLLAGLLPICAFGIYSIANGSFFFPNSVLLKSNSQIRNIFNSIFDLFYYRLAMGTIDSTATQRLILILPLVYLLFKNHKTFKPEYKNIIFITLTCVVFQLSFATTGSLGRYEAYLMFSSIPVVGVLIYQYRQEFILRQNRNNLLVIVIIGSSLFYPLIFRSVILYKYCSSAIMNIFDQQFQMGQFIKKYYNTDKIAVNDIGCTFYFSDGDNLDLWGLATFEIAKSKRENYDSPQFLYDLSKKKGIKVVMVYDSWFSPELLNHWVKTATWTIQNNKICGDSTVSFYSTDKTAQKQLKQNLLDYQENIPKSVKVRYL